MSAPRRTAFVASLGLVFAVAGARAAEADQARWRREAQAVTVVRDDWGIAHVHGRTDADAVFGMAYAQAEDDFNRVETNYLVSLGRLAEAEGEAALWKDLRQRLFIDETQLKSLYARSPSWLKALMDAWADGLNFYLATHPDVHPRVITRFEPWMALSFSEGSIGGDIERISTKGLQAFYGDDAAGALAQATPPPSWWEPTGSNGIAIAPKLTANGHALLLINPHTSFFFRSELQMTSDEGLNAYGAVTWGQFFIYQGFNPHIGWMHTSSGIDVVDEFAEDVVKREGKVFYHHGKMLRPMTTHGVTLRVRNADGTMGERTFITYASHHGPIVRADGTRWIATALMNKPMEALEQSWLRTKANDYSAYMKVAELKANSSNNTIYADDKGNIAYLHPQFIPARDDTFDYTKPVDGSDPEADWRPLLPLDKAPHLLNPGTGWIFNTNDWPYSAAGPDSPKQADYPRYMDSVGENPRGLHATKVLTGQHDMTKASLLAAAFDPYLPAFERQLPILVRDYDGLDASDPLKKKLAGPVGMLRRWDYRWGIASMPTTLAVYWGDTLWDAVSKDDTQEGLSIYDVMAEKAGPAKRLKALSEAVDRLERDFGDWGVPWGEVNRYQRNDGAIVQTFDDAKPSLPVPFTSSRWGSLASFGAHRWPGTKKYYGTSGNSFVAVVEFGPKVSARAVTIGGESGHPDSRHFDDEAERYTTGNLRKVYFWPEDLQGHVESTYHPGSKDAP
ncbi:penicillin acylase family protein [Luteibacter aegosomatis]|uniref:penicillin acylase family protein n=1 Tax=Luteibacter aegosomatis TaxID=2911537 RepID=UPI001FF8277A|nr:penicillin acylase family protein [Luteibacter aegosomatis]UPG86292.1 penicillin acylase family protein [Luteibacter aegosomatis]